METRLLLHARKEDDALVSALERIIGADDGPPAVMRREHEEVHAQAALFRRTLHELNEVEHPAIVAGGAQLASLVSAGAGRSRCARSAPRSSGSSTCISRRKRLSCSRWRDRCCRPSRSTTSPGAWRRSKPAQARRSRGARGRGESVSVLERVGNTPLAEIEGEFVKLECANPGGSVKDRIARFMLDEARRRGQLERGDTIVEATSGNTGIALAWLGRVLGHPVVIGARVRGLGRGARPPEGPLRNLRPRDARSGRAHRPVPRARVLNAG